MVAEEILPECDVVGIRGTSFINHTLEGLLNLCPKAFTVLISLPSPLSPALFDYGTHAIFGSKVVDAEKLICLISEAATFKEIMGVKLITLTKTV